MSKSMRRVYRKKQREDLPEEIKITIGDEEIIYEKALSLRYGENPHQPAAFYSPRREPLIMGSLNLLKSGKAGLSQTNLEDMNNSISIVRYFDLPACSVMKHLNPSGVAVANEKFESLKNVYIRARDCDNLAAFGSVVGFNTTIDEETAEEILSSYVECVIASSFTIKAMNVLKRKKDIRVVQVGNIYEVSRFIGEPVKPYTISMQIDGSIILSTPMLTKIKSADDLQLVTDRKASSRELADLLFSWYVCLNVRSNGVVVSKNKTTLGIGTGQQDRVTAVKIALDKAISRGHEKDLKGSVLASDGFFPFRDSIDLMAEYGVKACVQPGGSIRDEEVIAACDEHDIAMAFTHERCFRHF